jgi:hypothetical protein
VDCHAVADVYTVDVRSYLGDDAGDLVAQGDGRTRGNEQPVQEVQLRAAYPCSPDIDDDLSHVRARTLHVLHDDRSAGSVKPCSTH